MKFSQRHKSMASSKLPSSLHEFGNQSIGSKQRKVGSKIAVQPSSVIRRNKSVHRKNVSRQRQSPGR